MSPPRHSGRGVADGVQQAVHVVPTPGQRGGRRGQLGRFGDVDLEHLGLDGQLPGRPPGQGEPPSGSAEDHLGALALRRPGHGEGQRGVGQHPGDENPFTLEQSHQRVRLSSRPVRAGTAWCGRVGRMRIGILGGTGPAGRGLAVRLAAAGDEVVIGSRDAERARTVADGLVAAWPDRPLRGRGGLERGGGRRRSWSWWPHPWDSAVATVTALAARAGGQGGGVHGQRPGPTGP